MVDGALPCRRVYGFLDEAWLARFSTSLPATATATVYIRQALRMPVDRCQAAHRPGHGHALILVGSVDCRLGGGRCRPPMDR